MSQEEPQYKPGDVVNGHVLTAAGEWVPVNMPPSQPAPTPAPSRTLAAKIGMGVVWIGLVGWLLIGTALGLLITMFSTDRLSAAIGPIAGIVIGVVLYRNWLRGRGRR